jgi:hypothetical protein
MITKIATWNLAVWCVTLGIAVTLEMLGIFRGGHDTTLTALICRVIPLPLRVMVCAWLCFHFLIEHR